ncbi:MAG: bifunctional phosphopantothenoylcysteine decarboxylase/phosphopantothenate--cysteine ligase CoaBC [Lentisphaerae bacterium]|nr:bifunctional phosphopantothenoylcysteine decarboxylase/phosphopantothenate--cysteine ligase CoaBC [Lentisphaerota bacterium]
MRIVISAGPTREAIDPVRFITNRSTGKMGYAIAEAARQRQWQVTLVSGPVNLPPPEGVEVIAVESAAEMAQAMKNAAATADMIIMAAAVADYRPKQYSSSKVKKSDGDLCIELERTEDILLTLGKNKKPGQLLVGFAAETDDLLQNAQSKLERKNLDFIAANIVGVPGRGFASENNAITLLGRNGSCRELALQSKSSLADELLDAIIAGSSGE